MLKNYFHPASATFFQANGGLFGEPKHFCKDGINKVSCLHDHKILSTWYYSKDDAMHSDINCHTTTGCYAKHGVPQEADQQRVEQVHQHLPFDSYSEPANAKSVSDLKINRKRNNNLHN